MTVDLDLSISDVRRAQFTLKGASSLKSIRRRAVSPVIRWSPVGTDSAYRVVVRNQDSGERSTIYDGFQSECRLPPELRLTSDQLTYRVLTRPADKPDEKFAVLQENSIIPRIGDDYVTPSADLLTADPNSGSSRYRLLVRNPINGRPLVSMTREEPRFLLPVGQLRDGAFSYQIAAFSKGRWRTCVEAPINRAMIEAADERAERLVKLPAPKTRKAKGEAAIHAPGRADRLGLEEPDAGSRILVVVDVTAAPELGMIADSADVVRRQWWAGDGTAAVESVALALEAQGLRGHFQLDALSAFALGDDPLSALAHTLTTRGHGVGLMVNPEPWRKVSKKVAAANSPEAVLSLALERYRLVAGALPAAVSFAGELLNAKVLSHARSQGLKAVLADRAGQSGLPSWMRWRTAAFAAYDDLAVIPSTLVLSTPAHARDQVVRHPFSSKDPVIASDAQQTAAQLAGAAGQRLIVARIDPFSLLLRRWIRSAGEAETWNEQLAETLPGWAAAGWRRSPHGFAVLDGRDEIRMELMTGFIRALATSGVAAADVATVFSPDALRGWCEATAAFEPLVEHRRGPRIIRPSAVRRYDAAYLQALKAPRD